MDLLTVNMVMTCKKSGKCCPDSCLSSGISSGSADPEQSSHHQDVSEDWVSVGWLPLTSASNLVLNTESAFNLRKAILSQFPVFTVRSPTCALIVAALFL